MKRTTQQNKLYHEYCGQLHKQKQITVWDGRFGHRNPVRFHPSVFSYDEFRVWIAELNLDYPRDEEGKPISSTKLDIEQINSHITFLEVLCAELEGENKMLPTITVIGTMKRIEIKYTQSGKAVTKFQIECAEKDKKGEWTNLYLSGECWEKSAEFVNQYFRDGSPAIVTGKLFTNVYEKQDGTKVYENKLLFPSVSFVPKDKSGGQDNQVQAPQQQNAYNNESPQSYNSHTDYKQQPQQYSERQSMPSQQSIPDMDKDEIPF